MDPTIPGSTVDLEPRDLQRVHDWLRDQAGVDPDTLISRALDRCTWAAALFLARRSTEATALKSVKIAMRDEERWRSKALPESSAYQLANWMDLIRRQIWLRPTIRIRDQCSEPIAGAVMQQPI
jgi:hypothetical protein